MVCIGQRVVNVEGELRALLAHFQSQVDQRLGLIRQPL